MNVMRAPLCCSNRAAIVLCREDLLKVPLPRWLLHAKRTFPQRDHDNTDGSWNADMFMIRQGSFMVAPMVGTIVSIRVTLSFVDVSNKSALNVVI